MRCSTAVEQANFPQQVLEPIEDTSKRFFVRVSGNAEDMEKKVEGLFGPVRIVTVPELDGEFGFVTEVMTEGEYRKKSEELPGILHMIRIEER